MIAVLDTNVILRAAFRRNIDPDHLIARSRRGEFDIATSESLLAELELTIQKGRLQDRFDWDEAEMADFLARFRLEAHVVVPTTHIEAARDPADNRVLEAALEATADFIVTGDNDLLDIGTFEGIRIVDQAGFLAVLRAQRL